MNNGPIHNGGVELPKIGEARSYRLADLQYRPELQRLFAFSREVVGEMATGMKGPRGFDKTEPVLLGRLEDKGAEVLIFIDGHQRAAAAQAAGLEYIWGQEIKLATLTEAILIALNRHASRRKSRTADIVFALCVRHLWLKEKGLTRPPKSSALKQKLQNCNLAGTKDEPMAKYVTHESLGKLYGVSKSTVDHTSTKYLKALDNETIAKVAANEVDVYELIKNWDASKIDPETLPAEEGDESATQEEGGDDEDGTESVLNFLKLTPETKLALIKEACRQDLSVERLISIWLAERLNQIASNETEADPPSGNHDQESLD